MGYDFKRREGQSLFSFRGVNLLPLAMCYSIFPFMWMAFIARGFSLGVAGRKSMGETSKLDPAREFEALGKACTISKIGHKRRCSASVWSGKS